MNYKVPLKQQVLNIIKTFKSTPSSYTTGLFILCTISMIIIMLKILFFSQKIIEKRCKLDKTIEDFTSSLAGKLMFLIALWGIHFLVRKFVNNGTLTH